MKPYMKAFIAGCLMDSAFRSLIQDIHGKESYIRMIDASWISAWYTVPIALMVLAIAVKLFYDSIKGWSGSFQIFINGAKIENFDKELNIKVDNSLPPFSDFKTSD